MRHRAFTVWLLFVALASADGGARADLLLRYLPQHSPQVAAEANTATKPNSDLPVSADTGGNLDIYVTRGRVMLTGRSSSDTEHVFWFDSEAATFRVRDGSGSGYFEVSPSMFEHYEDGRKHLQQELQAKLKTAPADDHDKIKLFTQGLEKRLYGTRPAPSVYRPTGVETRVGRYSCSRTDVLRAQKKIRELCLAAPETLNVETVDWEVIRHMHAAGEAIFTASDTGARLIPRVVLDLGHGIPIAIRYLDAARAEKTLTLTQVSTEKIAPTRVTGYRALKRIPLTIVPANY